MKTAAWLVLGFGLSAANAIFVVAVSKALGAPLWATLLVSFVGGLLIGGFCAKKAIQNHDPF